MEMRHIRRILPLIFAVVFSLGVCSGVFAADSAPKVTLDQTSLSTGSQRTLTMTVELPQAVKAGGYELTCVYPEEFEITAIENDDSCVGGSLGSQYYNLENGMIKWFDSALEDKALTKLATVTFRIPANTPAGTYYLGVKDTAVYADRGKTQVFASADSATAALTLTSGGSGGGTGGGSTGGGGSGGGGNPGGSTDVDADAVKDVMQLIDEIGTVTKDSGDSIAAARAAYDELNDSEKSEVTNYAVLTAAEAAYETLNAGGAPGGFTDIADHWAREAIESVVAKGLFNGTTETTFEPQTMMSRAMLATVIWRLEGEPEAASKTTSFADVKADAYYAEAVAWANANGIVNGCSADRFAPNDNITREQLAAIFYRYAQLKGYELSARADLSGYADSSEISQYAVESLRWAVGAGVVNGRTQTTLVPQGTATRAEVATILTRWMKLAGIE